MASLLAELADRKRAQRGSVLSGVLIIVAFLAIIAGALTTELSTNLLISRALVNRVGNQATVTSAVELAVSQLQNTALAPLAQSCPSLIPAILPSGTAVANYVSCALVVGPGPTQFQQTPISSPFNVDGTHVVLPGRNDYLVGDAAGNVFDYSLDNMRQRWSNSLGGSVTGPPLQMPDVSNSPPGVIDLIPVSSPKPGASPDCGPANFCVASIAGGGGDDDSNDQNLQCFMATSAIVTARPAAGIRNPDLAYFGDAHGNLYAYDTDEGNCAPQGSPALIPGGQAVVAGPVVFSGPSGTDELYLLVSDGLSSHLVHYTYRQQFRGGLTFVSSLALPAPGAIGIAVEPGTLPSRLAITFSGGTVALAQIQAGFGMSLLTSTSVPIGIAGAPYWWHPIVGGDLIGVGGRDGLYLFDASLNPNATFPSGGVAAISTTPSADAAGDWFFGADDGSVYEVQRQAGATPLVLAATYGSGGAPISSSPILGSCNNATWICVYAGSADALYFVPLDARHAVVTACMSTSPPACSGTNPSLWASVEVGSASSPSTVHVQGWSYYSP